jgi:hypothetical protein
LHQHSALAINGLIIPENIFWGMSYSDRNQNEVRGKREMKQDDERNKQKQKNHP